MVFEGHLSHTRLRALSLVEKVALVQVRFTLRLRDQPSMWMQDGCKVVYMDSYMASNGSCSMVTWTIFKNHLLEVGLTQNQETMALQPLTTIGVFYFIMCEDPAWIEIHQNSILGVGPVTNHFTLHLRIHGHTYIILKLCWHDLWKLSFGLAQSHGHGSWLVCEVPPNWPVWSAPKP